MDLPGAGSSVCSSRRLPSDPAQNQLPGPRARPCGLSSLRVSLPDSEVPSTPAGHRRTQPRAHPVPAGHAQAPWWQARCVRPPRPVWLWPVPDQALPFPEPSTTPPPRPQPPVLTGISPSHRVTARAGPAARACAARLTRLESGDSHWRQPSTSQGREDAGLVLRLPTVISVEQGRPTLPPSPSAL